MVNLLSACGQYGLVSLCMWLLIYIVNCSLVLYRQQGQAVEQQGLVAQPPDQATLLRRPMALASQPKASQTSTSPALWLELVRHLGTATPPQFR